MPPLMRALYARNAESVREECERDPDVAADPFWDHDVEPPLCLAIRTGCGVRIVELLLQHGAIVDAVNVRGKRPLELLQCIPPQRRPPGMSDAISRLLLEWGAKPVPLAAPTFDDAAAATGGYELWRQPPPLLSRFQDPGNPFEESLLKHARAVGGC
jgi:hypothetical protein